MSYARGTVVAPEKSRADIERAIRSIGATSFVQGYDADRAAIEFAAKGRRLRFAIKMIDRNRPPHEITHDKHGRLRSRSQVDALIDAEERRLWRALLLVIKAKIESVESGIETFDQAFLANIIVPGPDGVTTVGEYVSPALASAYERGARMPPLLGAG